MCANAEIYKLDKGVTLPKNEEANRKTNKLKHKDDYPIKTAMLKIDD